MNELILIKLAEQSGFLNDVTKWETLVELVVRECISKLEEELYRSIDNNGDEAWPDIILKNHFGIEE